MGYPKSIEELKEEGWEVLYHWKVPSDLNTYHKSKNHPELDTSEIVIVKYKQSSSFLDTTIQAAKDKKQKAIENQDYQKAAEFRQIEKELLDERETYSYKDDCFIFTKSEYPGTFQGPQHMNSFNILIKHLLNQQDTLERVRQLKQQALQEQNYNLATAFREIEISLQEKDI